MKRITRSKKVKKEITQAVKEFCAKARIGFSAGGGTINVLAGEASRFYKINFTAAVRAVNKAAVQAEGWYLGAFFEEGRGDAHGFGRYLS